MTPQKGAVDLIHARPVPRPGRWAGAAVVAVLVAMAINALITNPAFQWPMVWEWLFSKSILTGVMYTLLLTVAAMVLGTILAVTMAVMRQSKNPILRYVATFYIWFFRGTPIYTQLIFWSLLPVLYPQLSIGIPFGYEFAHFDTLTLITPLWMAILGLGFNEGAYLAEIIRAGINSVDKGQTEAAEALGMSPGQIMSRIILPQAMRVIMPPLGNETISMLKTTSLVSAIPFTLELTYQAAHIGQRLFAPVPLLVAAAIWYLLITSILMVVQHRIEKHYGRGFSSDSGRTKADSKQKSIEEADPNQSNLFLDVTP
ncbi:amino acid ABC transporter permease [Actinomyces minihominis]|uniref:amino acid ABC transporter permease n=1 Tax=Actinomyces minihominis TaxID=2002838 RepID=UPI000C0782A2|nr:amino acid ABC transporter permease [Actinomyces minihominis]